MHTLRMKKTSFVRTRIAKQTVIRLLSVFASQKECLGDKFSDILFLCTMFPKKKWEHEFRNRHQRCCQEAIGVGKFPKLSLR